jgi:hypothetical protein
MNNLPPAHPASMLGRLAKARTVDLRRSHAVVPDDTE